MKRLMAGLFFLITAIGCSQPPPPPPQDDFITHQVSRSGETLAVIAHWYTGNSANWEKILADNPGLDPARMHQGTVVKIPRALVVRTEPLPASAVPHQAEVRHEAPVATLEAPKKEESYPDETDAVAAVVTPAPTAEPTAPEATPTPAQIAIEEKPAAAVAEKKVEESAVSSAAVEAPGAAPAAAANGAQ